VRKGYFFSKILQFIQRYGNFLLQIAEYNMRPVRKGYFFSEILHFFRRCGNFLLQIAEYNMWPVRKGYFFSEILHFFRRCGNFLLQIAEYNMRPVRKANFVNDLPVVEVLWIFSLQFIDTVGDFRSHRLKAYIPALFEVRISLYGCKRLG
jgi:hypothetical protein